MPRLVLERPISTRGEYGAWSSGGPPEKCASFYYRNSRLAVPVGTSAAFVSNPRCHLPFVAGIQASEIMTERTGCMVGKQEAIRAANWLAIVSVW